MQAIKTGLLRSLQVSGRASRSEFWWFAPIGAGLPLAVALLAPPAIQTLGTLATKVFLTLLACLPLTSAAARRFHDTGQSHTEFWSGMGPTVGLVLSGFLLAFGVFAMATIWALKIGLLVSIPSALLFLGCLFLAPGTFGSTIGQLLVPSEPGPNRYGPNPSEVSP